MQLVLHVRRVSARSRVTFETHSTGTLVIAVLIVSSVLYMTFPLGMIGKSFTDVGNDRHRILTEEGLPRPRALWPHCVGDPSVVPPPR